MLQPEIGSGDHAALRCRIRTWLDENCPRDWRAALEHASEDEVIALQVSWMRTLSGVGWAVPTLPVQYGGAGFSFGEHLVLVEEMAGADAPPLDLFMVTQTHAPVTILEWGTEGQKTRFLPAAGEGELWCQGFSEPNAGSDLASLRTRAVQDGDFFVINGQKIWSSFSRYASQCLLLARTDADAPKRKGISYFALDMSLPGIDVRPIRQATGNADFSEIFLTDVRVPADALLGPLNEGWAVAQSTLAAERGILAFERVERLWHSFARFLAGARAQRECWLNDPVKLGRLATIIGDLAAVRHLIRSFLDEEAAASHGLRASSVTKVVSTEIAQRMADFVLSVRGVSAQLHAAGFEHDTRVPMFDYIYTFGNTISAGANEIMKNIIAERVLAMPR